MKIYKVKKTSLKWSEIGQISYKWNLPILIDSDLNVLAGNSLKECLSDDILVIVIEKNDVLKEDLYYCESKIVEENSEKRIGLINTEIRNYLYELKKPVIESIDLFSLEKEKRCISESLYKRPSETITYAHGIKKEDNVGQLYLFDDEEKIIIKEKKNSELEIEIDLELMKELL